MNRFLKKIAVLVLLMLLVAFVLDRSFTQVFRNGNTLKTQWQAKFHDEDVDLLIAGSSRAYWNIDVSAIEDDCGIDALAIANNGVTPYETLLALKLFLANRNVAHRMLFQVDHRMLTTTEKALSKWVYHYLPWLDEDLVYDHLRPTSYEWWLLRHIPFARYARYNLIWGPEEVLMSLTGSRKRIFDDNGAYFTDMDYPKDPVFRYIPIEHELTPALEELFAFCRTEGIELDLFTSPYYKHRIPPGEAMAFKDLMSRHGHIYRDYSQLLDSAHYFHDNMHLNRNGGRILTKVLIDEIICPGASPADR